jgi:phosphotransferase system enzyme I (PtsI)
MGASAGVAIGPAHVIERRLVVKPRVVPREQRRAELERLDRAVRVTDAQIARTQVELEALDAVEGAEILEMHRLLLHSSEFVEGARRLVCERSLAAESAARAAFDSMKAAFDRIEDPYFRERRDDVDAVADRVLRTLLGLPEFQPGQGTPPGAIVVCSDIGPLEPIQLKRAGALGLVTESGGKSSHAAIVARALALPYVLGVGGLSASLRAGDIVIVDGRHGDVILNPDPETLCAYEARADRGRRRAEVLRAVRPLASQTLDGVAIHLAANLESVGDVAGAIESGAESIGLLRTEFLYLDRSELPSEEEQLEDALLAVRALGGRPATFRTLDVGADKLPAAIELPSAANPALGLRSIRLSLRYQEMFRTQLRALYRASAVGPIRIMFPLVSSVTEVREGRSICEDVCAELAAEGLPHDPTTPIGIMIETPSAAMTADHLARECDFFSIGTNDLIQYSFAADRDNEDVGYLYRPLHPAILRAIRQVVDAAAAANIPVSLCGDMAGDPALTWVLLGLGLRSLSMAPQHIAAVKSIIRETRLPDAKRLAEEALALGSEIEVEARVFGEMTRRFPMEFSED